MYNISYEMAEALIRHLYDTTYGIRKIKDTTPEKVQHLFNLHVQLQELLQQLEQDGKDITLLKQDIDESIRQKYGFKQLLVRVDGGVRGIDNKKRRSAAACGFMLYGDGELLLSNSYFLGDKIKLPLFTNEEATPYTLAITPNIAEYMAIIKALDYLITFSPQAEVIIVESDSEVVVNQVNLMNATRVDNLLRLRNATHQRMKQLGHIEIVKISREENSEVDALVNECIDRNQKRGKRRWKKANLRKQRKS